MQCEMLKLVGGSGERPWSPNDIQGGLDDAQFTAEELRGAEMRVGRLADCYFALIDQTPSGRSRKAAQLREIIRQRGLSQDQLLAFELLGPARVSQ